MPEERAVAEPRREARKPGEIGYQSARGGNVAGEHAVRFLGDGERIELTHVAGDRTVFARGALRAARWVVGQPPGRYGMSDVLAAET
jgi:4-hydroxy-tetrahydrodipicolinate reductase